MASEKSYSIDDQELNKILLCIFCRNNLSCRLWQDGRKNCQAFSMAKTTFD